MEKKTYKHSHFLAIRDEFMLRFVFVTILSLSFAHGIENDIRISFGSLIHGFYAVWGDKTISLVFFHLVMQSDFFNYDLKKNKMN